jgi:hypothetical protein
MPTTQRTTGSTRVSKSPIQGDPSWSRLLIVEGTSGIGKSTLIDRLIRRYVAEQPERKLRTVLHLTQAHTYGPLAPGEDLGTLTPEQNLEHLNKLVSMLEWHVSALAEENKIKFLAVIDTLHLTQCHRPGVLTWSDVSDLDRRLARLGARLVFLNGTSGTIWERGIAPRSNEEFITGYAKHRFGETLEDIHLHFVREQEKMRILLANTALDYLELDAERDICLNVADAYGFWLAQ